MRKAIPAFVLVALLAFGCGGEGGDSEASSDTIVSVATASSSEAKSASVGPSCEAVSPSVEAYYQENATEKVPGAELSHGHIVRSPEGYRRWNIYYVSFAVNGGEQVATWAQNAPDPARSMQVAVRESYADELSILGTAGTPPFSKLSWPGAKESQECVRTAVEVSG